MADSITTSRYFAGSAIADIIANPHAVASRTFVGSAVGSLSTQPRAMATGRFVASGVAALSTQPRAMATQRYVASAVAAIDNHPRAVMSRLFASAGAASITINPRAMVSAKFRTSAAMREMAVGPLSISTNQTFTGAARADFANGAASGINLALVAADALLCFGIAKASNAKPYVRDRVMSDINAALQLIYGRSQFLGYFNRLERSYPMWTNWATTTGYTTGKVVKESGLYYRCTSDHTSGTFATDLAAGIWVLTVNPNYVTLQADIQEIEGIIREAASHRPLRPLASMSQLEMFSEAFLGDSINTTGTPIAAFVQRETESATSDTSIKVFVAPTPTNAFTMQLDVLLKAPRYTWADVDAGTSLFLPHKYIESILMPIVRQRLSTSIYFVLKENLGSIEAHAKTAYEQLGLVDQQAGPIKKQKAATETATPPK